jgi:hypothetical protein
MEAIKSIIVIVAAAIVGVALSSLALYQSVERGSFVALIFAIPGTALIATSAGLLTKAGCDAWPTRFLIFLEGGLVGAFLLWLPSQTLHFLALGATYGSICTASWIALDISKKRLRTWHG